MPDGRALRVVAGPAPGAYIALPDGPATIGRARTGADVLAGDAALSDRHARVSPLEDGSVVVEDLGSQSGTWVQGRRIGAPVVLRAGDRFQVGGSILEIVQGVAATGQVGAPVRGLGRVQEVPGGLFELIGQRTPVTPQQIAGVFFIALGWAIAVTFVIRTLALEVVGIPEDTNAFELWHLLIATFMPVIGNSIGFYATFTRPERRSAKSYLIPTFCIPVISTVIVLLWLNHRDAEIVVMAIAITILPAAISATLLLRLRRKVAEEKLREVRGG